MLSWRTSVGACWLAMSLFGQQPTNVDSRKVSALGAQLAAEMRKLTKPSMNAGFQAYVERVGQRLGSVQESPSAWKFEVSAGLSDEPTHQPRPLPGQYIFVPERLSRTVQSEDELAGMLAHAMARRFAARPLTQYGTIPLTFVGGLLDESAIPLGMLPEQRGLELAADAEAVRILQQAGYNPQALVSYIARTQPDDLGPLSPLPERKIRLAALEQAIANLK